MPASTQINFSRGVPDPASFPAAELEQVTAAALKRDAGRMLQYGPAAGYAPLREYIASWFGSAADNVLIGNGSLELFGFACEALLQPGDTVFVESPSYDRAVTILKKRGVRIVGIEMGEDGVSLAALERALREHAPKLVYLIPDFQNPTGVCTSLAARRQIVQWAREKDFLIVEDGPYAFLRYHGDSIPSIYSLAPERTLHMCSFSKLIGPGVRIGFLIGGEKLIQQTAKVAETYYITPGYFAQGVVAEWCRRGLLEPQLDRLRKLYGPRLDSCVAAVDKYLPGTLIGRPQGGFFASLRLDGRIDEAALMAAAQETGLVLTSGNAFFVEDPGYRFVRLPFCALTEAEIEEGVRRLAAIVAGLSR
jgi:2-aminoadipate transaminase